MSRGGKLRLLILIFLFALFSIIKPAEASALNLNAVLDLNGLEVVEGSDSKIITNPDTGSKYYFVGFYRDVTISIPASYYIYEKEDKSVYFIISQTGALVASYITANRSLTYQNDAVNTFQSVKGFGLTTHPPDPSTYYIVSGSVKGGEGFNLDDFVSKAQDRLNFFWESATSSGASVTFRIGAGGPVISQGYVEDDGSWKMFHHLNTEGSISLENPNSIFMYTDRNKTIEAYVWYKDNNGQIWEAKKLLNLETDFKVHDDYSDGRVLDPALQLTLVKVTTPSYQESSDYAIGGGDGTDPVKDAVLTVLAMVKNGTEKSAFWITTILNGGNDLEDQEGVKDVWIATRNITLSLLTLGILIIAFMNILGIDIQTYGLGRILPRLIIGIVFTYFSFLISAFLLDMMSAFQALLFSNTPMNINQISGMISSIGTNVSLGDLLVLVLFGLVIFLITLWLCLILIARSAMLFILVSVSPIAFMAYILPFTERYYKDWWAAFWKWGFMGPAVAFMLWLANTFLFKGYFGARAQEVGGNLETWVWLVAAGVMLWLAATLPLKMGKEVYGAVQKGLKNARAGKVPGLKGAAAYLDQRKSSRDAARTDRVRNIRRGIANSPIGKTPVLGTFVTGANKKQRATLFEEAIAEEQKKLSPIKGNYNALHEGLRSSRRGSLTEAAYLRELGELGAVDTKGEKGREVMERFASAMDRGMPGVSAAAYKLRHQLYPAMAANNIGGSNAVTQAKLSVGGTERHKLNAQQAQFIAKEKEVAENLIRDLSDMQKCQFVQNNMTSSAKQALYDALSGIASNNSKDFDQLRDKAKELSAKFGGTQQGGANWGAERQQTAQRNTERDRIRDDYIP